MDVALMEGTLPAEPGAIDQFVRDVFVGMLRRTPSEPEVQVWAAAMRGGRSAETVVRDFVTSQEFALRNRVVPHFPDGHYYSPVVDPESLGDYPARNRARPPETLPGITLSLAAMESLWARMLPSIRRTPYSDQPDGSHRFYYDNGGYPVGDAVILRAMILEHQPRRIIEIGSGASSACMLDVADEGAFPRFELTCIDPYTERLRSMLRPSDRLHILENRVQDVALARFAALEPRDILFIDSTHVLKTGSDVHYELFYILPVLQPGVIVHVHDIPYPFEYHDNWVRTNNHSWNEAYALQAFLMYNREFPVLFWNSMLAQMRRELVGATYPPFLRNSGSGIWLVRR